MPTVRLGNHAALHEGEVVDGHQVTTIHVQPSDPHEEVMRTITHYSSGIWRAVSAEHPAWVSCPGDPKLEAALAAHFHCPIGEPDDVEPGDTAAPAPAVGPATDDAPARDTATTTLTPEATP